MGIGIILDIIIIVILSVSILLGYKKGLTKSLVKIFSFFIAIVISLILFKPISNLVIANTDIVNNLQNTITNTFKDEEEKNKKIESEEKQYTEDNNEKEKLEKEQYENSEKNFTNIFNKYIERKIIEEGNDAKDYVIDLASREISVFIVNISIYIILFIIIRIILIFIKALAEYITKIPGIKQCDELLGGGYGAIRACIIILTVFTILSIILSIFRIDGITEIINQSIISKFIYENNIIIKIFL